MPTRACRASPRCCDGGDDDSRGLSDGGRSCFTSAVCSHGRMSNDDDIERLLREIDGVTGSSSAAQPPAKRQESAPAKTGEASGGEMTVVVISAVIGIAGLLLGFLPFVPGFWLGLGGFLGAFLGLTAYRRFS